MLILRYTEIIIEAGVKKPPNTLKTRTAWTPFKVILLV